MASHPVVELKVGDTWTDITSYVRYRDMIEIRRGLSAEASQLSAASCTMTLDNRDGRFSPRNPSGAYYGQIGRNTPIRVSVDGGGSHLVCPGGASDYASTPDSAALSITGDLDVRVEVSFDEWPITSVTELAGKIGNSGQLSWALAVDSNGYDPFLNWSADGTTQIIKTATAALPAYAGGRIGIRATLDVDNGDSGYTLRFYTAPSIDGPWDQLGNDIVVAGTTSIFDSTAALQVGNTGFTSPYDGLTGRVYGLEVRDGIDGTIVANPDFTAQTAGDTSFADDAGNTWTLSGNTDITDRKIRFIGEVSSWPVDWDISGKDVVTKIEASGILRRLTQTESPLRSPMYRDFTNPERTNIIAYWPMEEAAGASRFTSGFEGHPAMTFTGNPVLSSFDGWGGSEPLPVIRDSVLNAAVPTYTNTGQMAFRLLMKVPESGVVAETSVLSLAATGTARRWELTVNTDGALKLYAYDGEGVQILDSTYINFAINGDLISLRLELVQDGNDVDYRLLISYYTTYELVDDTLPALEITGTLTGYTMGTVTRVIINNQGGLGTTSIGHLTIANDTDAYTGTSPAAAGWRGEDPLDRLGRLVKDEEGIPLQVVDDGSGGNAVTMGVQGLKDLVDLIRECGTSDLGILFEPRNEIGFAYRSRLSLYNQDPRLTLDYSNHQLAGPPVPVDDDRYARNDITVTRESGSFAKAVLGNGTLSVLEPPDGVGRYDESVTISVGGDDQLPDQASWRLHLGTIDEARYPQIKLNLRHSTFTSSQDMMNAVLEMDVGDRIVITNPPAWLPPDQINLLAVGFTETLGVLERDIVVNCVPESAYHVAYVDGDDYERVDTDGSELAEDLTTTGKDVSVAITDGPAWVIAAPSLITNYGFETDLTGWTGNGCTIERVATPDGAPFGGSWSMKLTPDGVSQFPNAGATTVPVTEGQSYTFSGWQMCETTRTCDLNINWFDVNDDYLDTDANGIAMSAGQWTWFEASAVAPLGAAFANIAPTVSDFPPSTDVLYSDMLTLRPTLSGELPGEFPLDVRCGGEVMRVTAITGIGSPQTFTVERSVNGVVKAHTPGTDIRLDRPAIISL